MTGSSKKKRVYPYKTGSDLKINASVTDHPLFIYSTETLLVSDKNGKIEAVNRRLPGIKKKELVKNTIFQLVSEKDAALLKKALSSVFKRGKPFRFSKHLPLKHHPTYSFEQIFPFMVKSKVEAVILSVNKAFILKQQEEELKQNLENYENLVRYSPYGIYIHDEKGKTLLANATTLKIMGIKSFKEIKDSTIFDYLLPEYLSEAKKRKKKLYRGQQLSFINYKVKRSDGSVVKLDVTMTAMPFNGKKAILSVCDDILQKKLEKEQIRAQEAEQNYKKLQLQIAERKRIQQELLQIQKYAQSIIDSSLDMICATDKEGKIIEINKAVEDKFGYSPQELIGKPIEILYAYPEHTKKTNEQIEKKGSFVGEIIRRKKNGEFFIAFVSIATLKNELGEIIGAVGISRDITETKKAEERLRLSEEKYKAIYNQAFVGIAQESLDGRFLQVNQRLCEMSGYSPQEMLKMTFIDFTHPDEREQTRINLKLFIQGKLEKASFEKRHIHKNGSIIYTNVAVALVNNIEGKPDYFVAVFEDITERKKTEEQIKLQASKLNAIIESGFHLIWTTDQNTRLTSFNANFADLIKRLYGIKPFLGMRINENEFWNKKYSEVFQGRSQHFEIKLIEKSGNEIWKEIYMNPIYGGNGTIAEVSGIGHDITEKKQVEEKIKQSLTEKEVLLKEVHHRVKNNLQVISSILNLQSSFVKDKKTLEILSESQNRIKSMSFIHEILYQTKDFSSINFSEYVANLSNNLLHSYANFDNKFELKQDVENIFLNLDHAIPCGLIINELVSNSFKHAFPGNKKGEITIKLKQTENSIRLVIGDNGVGFPDNINYKNTETLGLQLVMALVDQLNGVISLNNKKGTKYTIIFNNSNPNKTIKNVKNEYINS